MRIVANLVHVLTIGAIYDDRLALLMLIKLLLILLAQFLVPDPFFRRSRCKKDVGMSVSLLLYLVQEE